MDAPFSGSICDLPKLLIYFEAELQNRLDADLSLQSQLGGILFLGSSESISQFPNLLAAVDANTAFTPFSNRPARERR